MPNLQETSNSESDDEPLDINAGSLSKEDVIEVDSAFEDNNNET